MSKPQKMFAAWSVVGLIAAEFIKHRQFSTLTTTIIGGVEVALAILTGVGFAFVTLKKNQ